MFYSKNLKSKVESLSEIQVPRLAPKLVSIGKMLVPENKIINKMTLLYIARQLVETMLQITLERC
ncbi:MAG: hypothetical protein ACI9J3_003890 [Parvicellaceae bacterium]|jgi:hypothetical protein